MVCGFDKSMPQHLALALGRVLASWAVVWTRKLDRIATYGIIIFLVLAIFVGVFFLSRLSYFCPCLR